MASNHHIIEIEELIADLSVETSVYQYIGSMDKEIADHLIIEVDQLLSLGEFASRLRKKVFHVTVELVQNLNKYLTSKKVDAPLNKAALLLHGDAERIVVTTGNYILKSEVSSLKARIKLINSLTNDELVHFYRGLLDVGSFSDEGGAGLGFVDIAKKAGSKIGYEFKEVDNEYSFYIFKIIVTN